MELQQNESCKPYLAGKEQKSLFAVVSQSEVKTLTFVSCGHFLALPNEHSNCISRLEMRGSRSKCPQICKNKSCKNKSNSQKKMNAFPIRLFLKKGNNQFVSVMII